MKPLRILHVFRAPLGGLFRHVVDRGSRASGARGIEVGIFCDNSNTGGVRADQVFAELWPGPRAWRHARADVALPEPHGLQGATGGQRDAGAPFAADVVHVPWLGRAASMRAWRCAGFDRSGAISRPIRPHGGSFNYKPGGVEHRIYMSVERLLERATDMFCFESAYHRQGGSKPIAATSRRRRLPDRPEWYFGSRVRADRPWPRKVRPRLSSASCAPAKGVDTLHRRRGAVAARAALAADAADRRFRAR